jgi:hypothetical protein
MPEPYNEPAFPSAVSADTLGGLNYSPFPGATLRDYFAAHALTGVLVHPHATDGSPQQIADVAYAIADAMLRRRSTGEQK